MNGKIQKTADYIKKRKKHLLFISLIIISALIVHREMIFDSNRLYVKHDVMGYEYNTQNTFTNIILKYKEIPLWSNYIFGGTPFLAQPQVPLTPHMIIISLLYHNNISKAINYNMFFNVILGGIFIYYLLLRIKIKPEFAFISSLIFMFCGQGMILTYSWFTRHATYQWVPLVFLFFYLAFNEKKGIKYAILYSMLAGIFLAIQFMSGGLNYSMFMVFLLPTVPLVYIFGKNLKNRVIKSIIVIFVFSLVFLGIFAVKGLPLVEFGGVSSKESGYSLEETIGTYIKIEGPSDLFSLFVNTYLLTFPVATNVGIIAFIFLFFSLFKIKKRIVLNLWIILILIFLVSIGFKPMVSLFWKYIPGLSKLHHFARAFYLLQFAVAVLAGIGAGVFFDKIGMAIKNPRLRNLIYILVVIAVIAELGFIENVIEPKNSGNPSTWGRYDFNEQLKENKLMNYLAQQEGIFRVNHFSRSSICGIVPDHIVHYELEMLYGCYSVWIPEYFNVYLSVAYRDPAKLKGMLNTKYFFDSELINLTGIKLIGEFEPCDACYQYMPIDNGAIDGPYLYLNEKYLPRAYLADNGILLLGDKDRLTQAAYWLMLNPHFNPVDTVAIMESSPLNDMELNELLRFKVIILTQGNINQEGAYKLQQFANKGGKIYPNILNNEQQINITDLELTLDSFKKEYSEVKEADIDYYSADRRTIKLGGEKGFLVFAEKFFMFEGWDPKINGKTKNIKRANGINSAVYLDGEKGSLLFKYSPKSFKYGSIISLLTLLSATAYFVYVKRSKR